MSGLLFSGVKVEKLLEPQKIVMSKIPLCKLTKVPQNFFKIINLSFVIDSDVFGSV